MKVVHCNMIIGQIKLKENVKGGLIIVVLFKFCSFVRWKKNKEKKKWRIWLRVRRLVLRELNQSVIVFLLSSHLVKVPYSRWSQIFLHCFRNMLKLCGLLTWKSSFSSPFYRHTFFFNALKYGGIWEGVTDKKKNSAISSSERRLGWHHLHSLSIYDNVNKLRNFWCIN